VVIILALLFGLDFWVWLIVSFSSVGSGGSPPSMVYDRPGGRYDRRRMVMMERAKRLLIVDIMTFMAWSNFVDLDFLL